MIENFESRDFKFWYYHVSHGKLLLRSLKDSTNNKNIDIVFTDVIYVDIPRKLVDLKLEGANEEDLSYVEDKINKVVKPENITILLSNDKRYLIVASFMRIEENELDMFEMSQPYSKCW